MKRYFSCNLKDFLTNQNCYIHEQVREFLDPMAVSSNSGRNRQPRSGLLTPDSELADEEVDRLGGAGHHLQNPNDNVDTLGDGERALVHAMCNLINIFNFFSFSKQYLKLKRNV